MSLKEVASVLAAVPTMVRVTRAARMRPKSTHDCFAARVEDSARRFAGRPAVIFEGRTTTWQELNERSNRYAAAFKAQGLVRGDVVSLMMENRTEYLVIIIALNKLGVTVGLINSNLAGRSLVHCLGITNSRMCIVGEELLDVVEEVRSEPDLACLERYFFVADKNTVYCPDWATDLGGQARGLSTANPGDTGDTTLGEIALYIFTSGTTGLPKASVLSNRRYLLAAALSYAGSLKCDEHDCIYICLPLYHGSALFMGVGAAFCTGASMFVRRKFSASNFLPEVREYGATCFVYIGELCRYLLNTPEGTDDHINPLSKMVGNGLRPDVWMTFKQRFGVERIAEFYGASEGNVVFANIFNKDCTIGFTGIPHALVKYNVDADEIAHDDQGRCIKVGKGEPGLLLGEITEVTQFEGYTTAGDTEKKILRDVFKPGDAWFNTGDLVKTIDVGFALGLPHYQFVDRVGDTFRWKSENVSTNEVGEAINGHPQIAFCNVYGVAVPAADGRAGMAAIILAGGVDELDLRSLSGHINEKLPAYARPVFLRIQPEMDTTGTFKMVKGDLRKEAYHLAQVSDPVYVMQPGSSMYEPLDEAFEAVIHEGKAGY